MRKFVSSAVLTGASMLIFGGFAALAPSAGAITLPPGSLVNAPQYCLAVYGDPNPCPPPDRPDPVDPGCLRVDITPLRCPYQP